MLSDLKENKKYNLHYSEVREDGFGPLHGT